MPPRTTTLFRRERRQFLGYVGTFAKYGLVADVLTRAYSRMGPGWQTYAQSETIVEHPAGHYLLLDFVDAAGSASNIRRYRPRRGAVCTIEPGGSYDRRPFTILDGSTGANNRIVIAMTDASINGLKGVFDSNVTVQNVHFIGPHPVHYGYAWDGTAYCDEGAFTANGTNGKPQGACLATINGTNVVVRDCLMTGVKNLDDGVRGGVRYERLFAYYMESAGGLTGAGTYAEYDQCVLWQLPNHGISSNKAAGGRIEVTNSIFGNTQEVIGIGAFGNLGCDEFHWVHNTVYVVGSYYPNWGDRRNHCGHTAGLVLSGPNGEVRNRTVIKNNIFRMVRDGNHAIEYRALKGNLDNGANDVIDYNLYYYGDPQSTAKIRADNIGKTRVEWLSTNGGRDSHSLWDDAPIFLNPPPDFDNPQPVPGTAANRWGTGLDMTRESVATFRNRLTLHPSSPGKGAGDDGRDLGIVPTSGPLVGAPSGIRILPS